LAEHGRRRAQVRVLLHRLPNNEVLPSASSRTPTAVGSARATLATYYDGLRNGIDSRSQRKRRHPRGRRLTHENGALHCLPIDNYSRANCPTVHRQRHSTARTAHRNYFRPKFTSNFRRHLWDQFGTKLQFSSAYHPQTDRQTERVNQTMEQLIRTTCTGPQTWEKSLPLLEFAYNNAPSATTHQSPLFLNYRQDPVVPSTPNIETPVPRSQKFVEDILAAREKAAEAIRKANLVASRQADRHRRDVTYKAGDLVLLDTPNLRLPIPSKLRPRFCGPFQEGGGVV
ncbi:hypothetical protein CLOP_g6215, partial [Closterium sp. NIES-67]